MSTLRKLEAFNSAISCAFVWDDTAEGQEFWEQVSRNAGGNLDKCFMHPLKSPSITTKVIIDHEEIANAQRALLAIPVSELPGHPALWGVVKARLNYYLKKAPSVEKTNKLVIDEQLLLLTRRKEKPMKKLF